MTVVAFGTAALKSTKAAALLQEEGIYIDLIDLRSLRPLDLDPVIASVKRTGRLLVVDEFTEMYGISGEIAFQVSEKCFKDLKMPVQRYTLPDTIIPAGPVMEDWVCLLYTSTCPMRSITAKILSAFLVRFFSTVLTMSISK